MTTPPDNPLPLAIFPDWPAPEPVFAASTTRVGGKSPHPWQGLNMGHHVGDDAGRVDVNRALLRGLLPAGAELAWMQQEHGAKVVVARAGEEPVADACWTDEPGVACAVMTADCLPLLIADDLGRAVAAVHVGWRGLLAGVIEATLAALPVAPEHLLVWRGPAIGPAAFEVGAELRDRVLAAPGLQNAAVQRCFVPAAGAGKWLCDLTGLASLRLRDSGVRRIYGGGWCTVNDERRFFSYRRDGQTGRMASVICLSER